MNNDGSERDPLDRLADEFVRRYRGGQRPSLTEYARRHPDLADEIRDLFPALVMMEVAGSEVGRTRGASPDASATFPMMQRQLGDYRMIREIGRGGMGVVYEAEQISLARRVALKVLPAHRMLDSNQLKRFLREAQSAARLHHTNIVPVFEVGEDAGIHFYAMQFIQGQSLDEVLWQLRQLSGRWQPGLQNSPAVGETGGARPTRPAVGAGGGSHSAVHPAVPSVGTGLCDASDGRSYFRRIAEIGVQAAEALSYAHRLGILHRDIKPSNLLLDIEGTAWVTDFGLAKSDDSDDLTRTGDFVGTLRYMAPERFQGWSDARSDVYSLGVTLYEMLTLTPAFDESDRGRLIKLVLHENPPPPRKVERRLPRELETIVLKAIAKEPGQRYQSAGDFALDLQRFLRDEPIEARRASLRERGWLWCRRNPTVAALTTFVAVLLVLIAVGASAAALKLRAEGRIAVSLLERAREAERVAVDSERLANRRLYDSLLAQARATRWSGQAGRRFDALNALAEASALAGPEQRGEGARLELRNEAIACLQLTDLQIAEQWPCYPPVSAHVRIAFDADLERYARFEPDREVVVRSVRDNRELARFPGRGKLNDRRPYLQFSPDGRLLAIKGTSSRNSTRTRIAVWDLNAGTQVLGAEGRGYWHDSALDFSPDSRFLATGGKDGALVLYDLTTGEEAARLGSGDTPYCVRIHPEGTMLAAARGAHVDIVDRSGVQATRRLAHPDAVACVAWSSDGRRLAAACSDRQIYVWDVFSGRQHAVCSGHLRQVQYVVFNHGGDLLASSGWDSTTRLWDPETGGQLVSCPGRPVRFSRDDEWLGLGLAGSHVGRWKVETGRECRRLVAHRPSQDVRIFAAPQGGMLASATADGARLWDCKTGSLLAVLSHSDTYGVVFGPALQYVDLSSPSGIQRRPITQDEQGIWQFSRGRRIFDSSAENMSLSRDGSRLAAVLRTEPRAVVFDRNDPDKQLWLGDHLGMRFISLSPDGRWAATGPWNSAGVRIWDARTGAPGPELPILKTATVAFSPDGRWLATSSDDMYTFWKVGTWEIERRISKETTHLGCMTFDRDGRLAALTLSPQVVQLFDAVSGGELARLPTPEHENIHSLVLTPDGAYLAAGTSNGTILLWDLQQIRGQLQTLDLNWQLP
jgi:eukaryotic-like serine/threonine-protein kinase